MLLVLSLLITTSTLFFLELRTMRLQSPCLIVTRTLKRDLKS